MKRQPPLVLILGLALAACGGSEGTTANTASTTGGTGPGSSSSETSGAPTTGTTAPPTTGDASTGDASTTTDTGTSGTTSGSDTSSSTTGAVDPPGDPAVYRTPDVNTVCGPTPADPCTASDMTWVANEYGSTVTRADGDGEVYRLLALVEREGPANLDVFVIDAAGQPLVGVPVAFYFDSAPEPSRPDEWYPVKVTGVTEASGRVGFALAGSAYLGCGEGGPHAIWISQPGPAPDTTVPSDLADRLGMLVGTNHRHLDLLFQRVTPGDALLAPFCPLG